MFFGHGLAENVGHIKSDKNKEIANKLRTAFASWYDNGYTNAEDPNTIILKIKITHGILFKDGTRYEF